MRRTEQLHSVPTWLKHKPIFSMNHYDRIDGFYKNESDVIGLSLGKSQWDEKEFVPSVKVWRDVYNENKNEYKVSRQSEETTLTRALDLAYLVVRVYDSLINGKPIEAESIETIFGSLTIEKTEDQKLLHCLQEFLTKDNASDIKCHIAILRDAILNTKL